MSNLKSFFSSEHLGGFRTDTRYLPLDANSDGRIDIVEVWEDGPISAATTCDLHSVSLWYDSPTSFHRLDKIIKECGT